MKIVFLLIMLEVPSPNYVSFHFHSIADIFYSLFQVQTWTHVLGIVLYLFYSPHFFSYLVFLFIHGAFLNFVCWMSLLVIKMFFICLFYIALFLLDLFHNHLDLFCTNSRKLGPPLQSVDVLKKSG